MIAFDPNSLYSLDELRELLRGMVELPTFLDRLGLRDKRVFRDAVWGWEVIDASRTTSCFSDPNTVASVKQIAGRLRAQSSKGNGKQTNPLQKFTAQDLED